MILGIWKEEGFSVLKHSSVNGSIIESLSSWVATIND